MVSKVKRGVQRGMKMVNRKMKRGRDIKGVMKKTQLKSNGSRYCRNISV